MSKQHNLDQLLFSYGTLQDEMIQLEIFGRKLIGVADKLYGYRVGQLEIATGNELQASNIRSYPAAVASHQPVDCIAGMVYQLSPEELGLADLYETSAYRRVHIRLESGRWAWVYISDQ